LGEKCFHGEKETRSFENIVFGEEISSWNREKQKNFLDFCSEMFRLALLQNYDAEIWFTKIYLKTDSTGKRLPILFTELIL
jgi:DNA polymerase-3 subunit delta'